MQFCILTYMFVFSHGFGVKKDDRGLFTDLAKALGEENCLLFDYNTIDEKNNSITVAPLDEQAKKLSEVLGAIDEPVNLICHSQGCLVAALANPRGLQSILFLAPPQTMTSQEFIKIFKGKINLKGDSTLKRKDGSTTFVPQTFWQSLDAIENAESLYAALASGTFLTIITAEQDEVLGKTAFPELEHKAEIFSLKAADHNFSGEARQKLIDIFSQLSRQETKETRSKT